MDLSILEIFLHSVKGRQGTHVGHLFRYGSDQANGVMRFVPLPEYVADDDRPVLSLLFTDENPEETRLHLTDIAAAEFNGRRHVNGPVGANGLPPMMLPAWFQNLLPEGAFRAHIAQIRGCSETDYFELLAACGADLPGAVYALPVKDTSQELMQRLVTQNHDALEASVVEIPLLEGISLSGIQPKLGVNKDQNGRYVARTKLDEATHIIAKLPAVDYPLMPEVEHLSMELARMAGVNACETELVPLEKLMAKHHYDIGDPDLRVTNFLAIPRYDRSQTERVHAEDFAQALGFLPHEKYSREASYSLLMRYMMAFPSLDEAAVLELLRRLAVNELLGNPDCHLKNIGVYFPDGKTPELPPAYDIVAHHVYNGAIGHALYILPPETQKKLEESQRDDFKKALNKAHEHALAGNIEGAGDLLDAAGLAGEASPWPRLLLLRASTLKALAEEVGLPYKLFQATANAVVTAAATSWPAAINKSGLTSTQKERLKGLLERHPAVRAFRKREPAVRAGQGAGSVGSAGSASTTPPVEAPIISGEGAKAASLPGHHKRHS